MFTLAELRSRARNFAADHAEDGHEQRDKQTYWNDFFAIFGIDRRRVGIYEAAVHKITGDRGFIDFLWPGTLIVEQKSRGGDLFGAQMQAIDYLLGLKPEELPKYRIVCDFRSFILTDFETGEDVSFLLPDLPKHIHRFLFILGKPTTRFRDQDQVNIQAAELVGKLHDALEASGYTGHQLEVFLTRIVFCLFADDTGIFEPKDLMWDWLDRIGDPAAVGPALAQLFDTLNTPPEARQSTLPEDLARFPHINGHLFAENLRPPAFNEDMRTALLNACRFDWTPISPAIFGALFQSVMNKAERRRLGAHYTTEKNILKLIGPLFMDDLRAAFDAIRTRKAGRERALEAFHDRLATLTFFDPACGCGNFLVIAYREVRRLEIEVILERFQGQFARAGMAGGTRFSFDVTSLARVNVDQFYGIEIEEFPARIASTALWMMDHVMNVALAEALTGDPPRRIPLRTAPTIVHGDALELDWASVLPPERCSFVMGNPPFIGAKFQSGVQRAQVRRIAALGKSGGTLDYVAAWFLKAGEYVGRSGLAPTLAPRIAFVATNSVTQGEQVAQLWPLLFDRHHLEIAFAHRTFAWGSDARGKAHVHVVILGLDRAEAARAERRLYSYPDLNGDPVESTHKAISPYLFDAGGLANPHTVVKEVPRPINGLKRILIGSKPIDGGHYIFDTAEMRAFLAVEPEAEPYFRPYIGSREFLQGGMRFILYIGDATPNALKSLRKVREVIDTVRSFRLGQIPPKGRGEDSKREPGLSMTALAETPRAFHVTVVPTRPFLALPEVSSERRDYIPIAWLEPPTIPSNKVRVLPDAELWEFALLTSRMHVSWARYISGRLKSDFQYGIGVVYNTFPLPPPGTDLTRLAPLAQAILDARAAHPGATLATLYDPDLMPANLRRAHQALDRAVDRLYRRQGFASDRERVEHLFALYEALAAPLLAGPKRKRR
jgi:hypothetical protein